MRLGGLIFGVHQNMNRYWVEMNCLEEVSVRWVLSGHWNVSIDVFSNRRIKGWAAPSSREAPLEPFHTGSRSVCSLETCERQWVCFHPQSCYPLISQHSTWDTSSRIQMVGRAARRGSHSDVWTLELSRWTVRLFIHMVFTFSVSLAGAFSCSRHTSPNHWPFTF